MLLRKFTLNHVQSGWTTGRSRSRPGPSFPTPHSTCPLTSLKPSATRNPTSLYAYPRIFVNVAQLSLQVSWNQRDLLLYALGIGAKKEDFPLVYELDKNWAPFPTYPVVLNLKGNDTDLNNFVKRVSGGRAAPGLPAFDPNRGVRPSSVFYALCVDHILQVHGSQSIQILKPIPAVSGDGWKLSSRISGVHENSEPPGE
jgi:hypothetical protein